MNLYSEYSSNSKIVTRALCPMRIKHSIRMEINILYSYQNILYLLPITAATDSRSCVRYRNPTRLFIIIDYKLYRNKFKCIIFRHRFDLISKRKLFFSLLNFFSWATANETMALFCKLCLWSLNGCVISITKGILS